MSARVDSFRIAVIPPDRMRYKTVGDWTVDGSAIDVTVAAMEDGRYNFLIAVHELIEAFLCHRDGVTMQDVDRYDFAHQDEDDPGLAPAAPYHTQHLAAFAVEILLAGVLGVDWRAYTVAVDAAYDRAPNAPAGDGG